MSHSVPKFARSVLVVSTFFAIASCGGRYNNYDPRIDPIDQPGGLTRQDYIDQLNPKPALQPVTIETKTPPIPKASEVVLTPQKPRLGVNKTVSISVTEDVPLKDVFIELARLADVDIEVDPSISGGVIFKAKNRPFDDVVQRICDLAGLRYSINNGVIRIERDAAYVENYQANFLNLIRTSVGKIDIDTKTLGNDNSTSSSGTNTNGSSNSNSNSGSNSSSSASSSATGSQSSISSKNGGEGDIWASIEKELNALVNANPSAKAATNSTTPSATATANSVAGEESYITLNREAGIISVRTTAKNQAKVKEYMQKVKDYYSSQVLIEAKVIEIGLNDEFRSGVDWSILSKKGHGITVNPGGFPTTDLASVAGSTATNLSTISFAAGDLNGIVKLAQIFGTTKTLSSPRILVMNNQQAVLNFSINENYFTVQCSTTTVSTTNAPTTSTPTVTSTLHTIPIGIILGIQPSIDLVNNEVTMNVHPTLSRLTGVSVPDPAAAGCNAINQGSGGAALTEATTITSSVPQVDIREMDSVLRVKSGEVMAIGGMIDQKNSNNDSGLPILSDIPVLGYAFKTVDKGNSTTQTIIFLKATIVPGYGVDSHDQQLYNKFNNDPHPVTF